MELEVGKFVRTKDGTIGKIIAIDLAKPRQEKYPNHPSKKYWRDKILISCYKGWITTQNIIKASYSIIDILEIGDYVNGSKVIDISIIGKDKEKWVWVEQMEDTDNKYGDDYVGYNNEQIKSIVTKEQMEQMAYKVGE